MDLIKSLQIEKIHIQKIADALDLKFEQVNNTLELFEQDATIPFISRYRKEATGGLDEVKIQEIQTLMLARLMIESRRATILKTIESQGKLTDELRKQIEKAETLTELEDLYLPYKPKKRTRAKIAKEKGLEPLAEDIFKQEGIDPFVEAEKYLTEVVETVEDALAGARDIIAEWVNEDKDARFEVRKLFERDAKISSKVWAAKKEEAQKYKDYFDFEQDLDKCPSHRILAMFRADNELFLQVIISVEKGKAVAILKDIFVKGINQCSLQVEEAIDDCYSRLLFPSIENEFRKTAKARADKEAIEVFVENLRQLLLAAPLGQKRVLAIDPGFRTGCKVVCLDSQGNLLKNDVIYPHPPQNNIIEASKIIMRLAKKYNIEAISIGNGTASRETDSFVRQIPLDNPVDVFIVSEDGASIYSASEVAREEFGDYDVTVRGAVSIGRRLMDPLAELVKIDPKSLGIGQYQHDVDQMDLHKSLDMVVSSCVNLVGVNVNTASKHLLTYVSGLGPVLAQNIIDYRTENGAFEKRSDLKKVARLGAKAFEQSAGFLRISKAKNPLDNSAVHPETYPIVKKMAKDLDCKVDDLMKDKSLREKINLSDYVTEKIGLPTLKDIMSELEKPGRDPREQIESFKFDEKVKTINDLTEGMILPGIVTNITKFGAFVDIGIKENGLIHVSEMADKFVGNPSDVVKVHEKVEVRVLEIDKERGRVSLSMKRVAG